MVKKQKAVPAIFIKMKDLILEYYTEPGNIKRSIAQSEMEERCANDDLEEFGLAAADEASQQTDAEVEGVTCIHYIYLLTKYIFF